MLRSMYSGISGLKNFQTKLDVIGNNISNVNTFGFKKGRVVFKDMFSQSVQGASSSTATRGGTNAIQVGLGSQLAAIDTVQEGGSLQTTSRTLDLAISGNGFFVVADATTPPAPPALPALNNNEFTRAGNFYLDKNGYLVNVDGKYVSGGDAGAQKAIYIPTDAQSMTISKDGTVSYVDAAGALQTAGKLLLAKFSNASGLEKDGSNYYKESNNSGTPVLDGATTNGIGEVASGTLEMSNVDLSEEFTEMIVAQRAFQANSRIITTSDEILQELVNLKR